MALENATETEVTPAAATALWAFFALAIGVSLNYGYLSTSALQWTVAGFALALMAMFRAWGGGRTTPSQHYELLYAGLLGMAVFQWCLQPHWGFVGAAYVSLCHTFGEVFIGGVLLHALLPPRLRPIGLWIVVLGALALLGLNVHYYQHPGTDVWQLQQGATDHLLHGRNPYTHEIPNSSRSGYFGYRIDYYDYLPLNLLVGLPGYLIGHDYRYSLVACVFVVVAVIQLAGRRLGVAPRLRDIITFAFLLHPANPFCMFQAWTEPMMLAVLALFVYFAVRAPRGYGESICLLLLPTLKPYFLVPLFAYVPILKPRFRSLLVGALVVAATLGPFLIWNYQATIKYGLLFTLQHVPFRGDSLSIPGWLYQNHKWQCGKLPALIAQIVVGGISFGFLRRRGLGGFLLLSAMALYASFLAGSQAFTNYYFFVGGVLILAALVMAAPSRSVAAVLLASDPALALPGPRFVETAQPIHDAPGIAAGPLDEAPKYQ